MSYLILQLWVHLLIALAIGVYIGWVIWGRNRVVGEVEVADNASLADLRSAHQQELAAARAIVADHRSGALVGEAAVEIEALRSAHAQELAAARAIVAQYRGLAETSSTGEAARSAQTANVNDGATLAAIRSAHAQELAAARAIVSDYRSGALAGELEVSRLKAAHEQELSAARAIMAQYAANASDADVDALSTMQEEIASVADERDALQTENEALRARIDILEKRRTRRNGLRFADVASQPLALETAPPRTAPQAEAAAFVMRRTKDAPEDVVSAATPTAFAAPLADEAAPVAAADGDATTNDDAQTQRPALLDVAPDGGGDDLKKISGVGVKLESRLHDLGVYTYAQIASWTDAEVRWVDGHLRFKGRIERDQWIAQAKTLADGGETTFSKRVEAGGVYS